MHIVIIVVVVIVVQLIYSRMRHQPQRRGAGRKMGKSARPESLLMLEPNRACNRSDTALLPILHRLFPVSLAQG
jgi:hypothetical protein